MLNKLKAWFWRDPDPIWRWASGQTIRRWWNRPLIMVGLVSAFVYFLDFALFLFVFENRLGGRDEAFDFALFLTCGVAVLCTFLFFLLVAARPFSLLRKLGGPSMLRAVAMTPLGHDEIPRRLFWGSYRNAALPFLSISYMVIFAVVILALLEGSFFKEFDEFGALFLVGGSLAVIFLLKPPIDHMLNLAIGWWFCFKTGRGNSGLILTLIIVIVGFPALRSLITNLVALPIGFIGLTIVSDWWAYIALAVSFVTIGGILAVALTILRRRKVKPLFRLALLLLALTLAFASIGPITEIASESAEISAFLLWNGVTYVGVYALKIWYARRCYRKFVRNWDTLLNEKFGD